MGIAADLFWSSADAEQTLDWRIRPTDGQFDAQQARWNALAEYLLVDLQTQSGCSMSSWLQGSYKFGTQIRPASKVEEFDIDLGVYFRWPGQPEDGLFDPLELKGLIQASLQSYAANAENEAKNVSPAKAKCSRIHFDDSFHIDVPAYHLDGARDARMLATAKNEWEDSDPKAIYGWWKNQFDDASRARARRIVRYFKMWAALTFEAADRPSSILLTVLVADAISQASDSLAGDDEWLREIADKAARRLRDSSWVPNPINASENLNRLEPEACANFIDELEDFRGLADRALSAITRTNAADIWSEAFSHFFPLPEEELLAKGVGRALTPVIFDPQVAIVARSEGSNAVIRGTNSIGPIPRDCTIDFNLTNINDLPHNAVVSWTVRNEGDEAEATNDLGHRAGIGITATEYSAYRGRHHMDVVVKQYGRLVGYRRVPVTIGGIMMPKRNPPRPAYVRLRGRR